MHVHVLALAPHFHCPLFASGHVMQGMQVCLRSKISWASEREISCEIDHTESSERSETVRVGSERFFSLSLERQRSAGEMASFGRYAPPSSHVEACSCTLYCDMHVHVRALAPTILPLLETSGDFFNIRKTLFPLLFLFLQLKRKRMRGELSRSGKKWPRYRLPKFVDCPTFFTTRCVHWVLD